MSVKQRMSVQNLLDNSGSSRNYQQPNSSSSSSTKTKSHKCTICNRAFNKREHLKRHKLLVHEEHRPFNCSTCELRFGTKQNMQVHLTTRKHKQRVSFLQHAQQAHHHSGRA